MIEQTIHTAVARHPQYTARRKDELRAVMHHALGTLFVLGALALIVNV